MYCLAYRYSGLSVKGAGVHIMLRFTSPHPPTVLDPTCMMLCQTRTHDKQAKRVYMFVCKRITVSLRRNRRERNMTHPP